MHLKTPSDLVAPRPSVFRRARSMAVLVAAAAFVAGCAEPKVQTERSIGLMPANSFSLGWSVDMDLKDATVVKLDVRDKLVYVYTSDKKVTAFDRRAGTFKFTMQVPSPSTKLMPLVELADKIVFPNPTALEVFNDRGEHLRSISLSIPLRSNAVGEGNTVYFGAVGPRGGLVEAFDMNHPLAPQKWEFLMRDGGDVTAGPAINGGVLFAASENGEVDAVNTARAPIWDTEHNRFYAYGPVVADLQADDAGLYISSKDSNLYCVNKLTGKLKWQYFSGSSLNQPVAATSDTVYQYVPEKGLVAIDKMSGDFDRKPRWVYPGAVRFLAQDARNAYLSEDHPTPETGDAPGHSIVAVNKMTGSVVFESKRADFTLFGTNQKDGLIYAATTGGRILTIAPVLKAGQIGELVCGPVTTDGAD